MEVINIFLLAAALFSLCQAASQPLGSPVKIEQAFTYLLTDVKEKQLHARISQLMHSISSLVSNYLEPYQLNSTGKIVILNDYFSDGDKKSVSERQAIQKLWPRGLIEFVTIGNPCQES